MCFLTYSKRIVTNIVVRETTNKGGTFINPRGIIHRHLLEAISETATVLEWKQHSV